MAAWLLLLNIIFFPALLLVGCGGDAKVASTNSAGAVQIDYGQVVGYWQPKDGVNNDEYEFFSSPLYMSPLRPEPDSYTLRQGRIVKDGIVKDIFYWDLDLSGTILISAIGTNCKLRPISSCPVQKRVSVKPAGDSIYSSTWSISVVDSNGEITKKIRDVYTQKRISFSAINSSAFYLSPVADLAFGSPMKAWLDGTKISVRLEDEWDLDDGTLTEKRLTFTGEISGLTEGRVNLINSSKESFSFVKEFYINNIGYKNLIVKQTYDNVSMSSSVGNGYVLSYEVHRQIQVPDGVALDQINEGRNSSSVLIKDEKKTIALLVIDRFAKGPRIEAGNIYFCYVKLDFDSIEKSGGKLEFTTATEGNLSIASASDPLVVQVRHFKWEQSEDGGINLLFPESGYSITLQFVSGQDGSYQVLYTLSDIDKVEDYRLTDFVIDHDSVMSERDLPGRYEYLGTAPNLANPYTFIYEVEFHKNGAVTGDFEGYWFKDLNGDFISYECNDKNNQPISDRESCLHSFDNLSSFSLAHIRKFKIIHKNEDGYRMAYTSNIYVSDGAKVLRNSGISLVFRMRKVGDSH